MTSSCSTALDLRQVRLDPDDVPGRQPAEGRGHVVGIPALTLTVKQKPVLMMASNPDPPARASWLFLDGASLAEQRKVVNAQNTDTMATYTPTGFRELGGGSYTTAMVRRLSNISASVYGPARGAGARRTPRSRRCSTCLAADGQGGVVRRRGARRDPHAVLARRPAVPGSAVDITTDRPAKVP